MKHMPSEVAANRQAGVIAERGNGIRGVTRITGNIGVLKFIDATVIGWSGGITGVTAFALHGGSGSITDRCHRISP